MTIGARAEPDEEIRGFARLLVRSSIRADDEQLAELVAACRDELPHLPAEPIARAFWLAARKDWLGEAAGWPEETNYDRLVGAFAECRGNGVLVRGVAGESLDPAAALLAEHQPERGLLWFTERDIAAALDRPVLSMTLIHTDGRPVDAASGLTRAVTGCIERRGVPARFHEGRIQAAALWQRRPK